MTKNKVEKEAGRVKTLPIKKRNSLIKRLFHTDSTRDAIFFFLALFVILPTGLIFLYISYNIYSERKIFANKYDYIYSPDIKDFKIALISFLIILVVRINSVKYIFQARAEKTVIDFPSKEYRKKKVAKAAYARFRCLWYLFITAVGYYCLREEEWFPRTLGGKARFKDLYLFWDELPYQAQSQKVIIYYMIQIGSAFCTFILRFKQNHTRNNYSELLLHDMATIMLLSMSYLNNYLRMGAVVLFLHDISDIFSYGCKIFVDTEHINITLFFFFGLVVSWIYTRLIVYPFEIILQCFTNNIWARPELVGYMIIAICLSTLLVLHIYWIIIFISIGTKYLNTGEPDDLQDTEKTEDSSQSKYSSSRDNATASSKKKRGKKQQ